jgi:hypothetical protein
VTYVVSLCVLGHSFRNTFTSDMKYVKALPLLNFSLPAASEINYFSVQFSGFNLWQVFTKDTESCQESDYLECGSGFKPTSFTYPPPPHTGSCRGNGINVFGKLSVWILARAPTVLNEVLPGLTQFLHTDAKIIPLLDHGRFLLSPLKFIIH